MKTLSILVLLAITAFALTAATRYAESVPVADLVTFGVMFCVTIPLGVVSGAATMYYHYRRLGLISPGLHLSDQFWFWPGLIVGLDMAALGLLLPAIAVGKYHVSPTTVEWMLQIGAPVTALLTWPAALLLLWGCFALADRLSNAKPRRPVVPCLV